MQWLMNHTLILSGLILLLLFITPIANRLIGVIATYALWALIPISLVTNSLSPWLAVDISHKLTAWTSVKSSLKEVAKEQYE